MKRKFNFDFNRKTQPFPHQVEAIDYISDNTNVALFDEQGVGKTKIVIDALCRNMAEGKIDGSLIICKKSLIANWEEEIETHSYLKSIVLRGSDNEKGTRFMGFSHFYIINYESLMSEVNRLSMFLKIRKMAIVLDESHRIKGPESKSTQAIFSLRDKAQKRIIITGTPIANRPVDLWAQYYFLDGGSLLGNDFDAFKDKYAVDLKTTKFDSTGRFDELKDIIKNNSMRRLKNDVLQLPEKFYHTKRVSLTEKQASMYEQLKNELYIEIENSDGQKIIDESNAMLKKLLRLAQLASNPFLIDKSYKEEPAKFNALDKLVQQIISKKEKAIVWSSFVENIRILAKRYGEYGALQLYGDIPIEKRTFIVKKFKTDESSKILIANPAAAKEGLTLTSANHAIYLDRNFNLTDYLQSQDRIHRISQKKECHITKIIADNTIDEYIDEILYKMHSLAKYIQGDASEIKIAQHLTKEEILRVLGGPTS